MPCWIKVARVGIRIVPDLTGKAFSFSVDYDISHGRVTYKLYYVNSSVQSLSRIQLCDRMDCSLPGFPVQHQLPELIQTHVHWVGDAIQPSHPLLSPSPPAFNLSQHQGLFQWVSSSYRSQSIGASASASVLLMNVQDWFPLGLTGLISLQFKGLSWELLC